MCSSSEFSRKFADKFFPEPGRQGARYGGIFNPLSKTSLHKVVKTFSKFGLFRGNRLRDFWKLGVSHAIWLFLGNFV